MTAPDKLQQVREALLPCPFCGGKAELGNLGDDHGFYVNCTKCEVQQIANYTHHQAIGRWNSRTPPPTQPRSDGG